MPVQRDQELQVCILLLPDLLEPQIYVLLEYARNALLLFLELAVDFVDIGLELGVWLNFGLLMVHFHQR